MEKGLLQRAIKDFFTRNFDVRQDKEDELETIACTVDGSKEVIRGRYEIYEGDKNYGN